MLTVFQIRAARAGLGLTSQELAAASKVGRNTILSLETGEPGTEPEALASTLRKLRDYYESAGVEFLPGNGLRFAKSAK